jgi:hypothetical protein
LLPFKNVHMTEDTFGVQQHLLLEKNVVASTSPSLLEKNCFFF